ncbi:MAG: hypothetical protein U9Q69_02840 [Nanoarchaeota archaeon]|nr:hypothetical protein [Nanoarchaeota archaeon]
MQPRRQTAYKFWIKDLIAAKAEPNNQGFMAFRIKGKDVIRVNVLATIIHEYNSESGNYKLISLDDGSGQIRVKAWGEDTKILKSAQMADLVLLVGKLGWNNNEIFIRPEAIKKVENPDWELVRKLELLKEFGKPESSKKELPPNGQVIKEEVVEPASSSSVREKVVALIEKSSPDGIEEIELIKKINAEEEIVEKAIKELLSEGEIFQPKNGYLKLIG